MWVFLVVNYLNLIENKLDVYVEVVIRNIIFWNYICSYNEMSGFDWGCMNKDIDSFYNKYWIRNLVMKR